MHPYDSTKPPMLAIVLGYAGLIPFISGALGFLIVPVGWRPLVLNALLDYAAIILAFMGAIHWGLAMRAEESEENARTQMGLSVIPPLLGWLAIADGMPLIVALPVLLLAFAGLYVADVRAVNLGLAPRWYTILRTPLTGVVSLCLTLAWIGEVID